MTLPADPGKYIKQLEESLDEAYRRTTENLPGNAALRVDLNARGTEALDISGLGELGEPASLAELGETIARIELPLSEDLW